VTSFRRHFPIVHSLDCGVLPVFVFMVTVTAQTGTVNIHEPCSISGKAADSVWATQIQISVRTWKLFPSLLRLERLGVHAASYLVGSVGGGSLSTG
jgi:hypothetical protein